MTHVAVGRAFSPLFLLVAAVLAVGCSCERSPGTTDSGLPRLDAGRDDSGSADDAGSDDAASTGDAGSTDDASFADDAGSDAGASDAGGVVGEPCGPSTDCGIGYYCHTPDGACSDTGVCERFDTTSSCAVGYAPVCGCDGTTFNNACSAARAGIAIDRTGACDASDACTADADCGGGSFCEFPDGLCGGTGTCTSSLIGVLCTAACTPECGCDGESYVNACHRRHAGASLAQSGTCPGAEPPCAAGGGCCATSADCLSGQECAGPIGGRKCMPIPVPADCWTDTDCDLGFTCHDAFICPCGSTCPRPDATGTCG